MTPVGFEPTQLALVELESTPLDHSGKVSWRSGWDLCAYCALHSQVRRISRAPAELRNYKKNLRLAT